MTTLGLSIPTNLKFEEWERTGRKLSGLADSSTWWLGDWLVYGQNNYADRYKRAVEAANLSYQTLRNYAWVARKFDMSRRRAELTFQHHAEVASLPVAVQNDLLDRAEREKWTTKQLRTAIRTSGDAAAAGDAAADSARSRIEVPQKNVRAWREAADRAGVDFDSWVLSSLDRAAEQVLGEPVKT